MAINVDDKMADPQTDAIWILSSTFLVFTMQSGFGLLESGSVSVKNELNIMVKNAVDVVFGGLTYWLFGYGLSFGESDYSNAFVGWGHFFVNADEDKLGVVYSRFFFQASFATTATTIVSGAMAERTNLVSYMVFSMVSTVLFSIPAHWIWSSKGWLYSMGVVDIAGAGPVHVVGGLTGLVATLILKPRHGRYSGISKKAPMSSPTNAVLGMFMLWWGWLGFNCGSTFGISGVKWKLAARSAASTLCASLAGGVAGFMLSYVVKDRRFDVTYMINGLLGSLVSVTAVCAVVQPWEALIIGGIGSIISNAGVALLDKLEVDDPVGCVGTHALSGSWGMLAAGLFIQKDEMLNSLYLQRASTGLFYGGGFHQLGIQILALVSMAAWTVAGSYILLKLIQVTIGLRVSLEEEIIGADIVEHGIGEFVYDRKTKTLSCPDDDIGADDAIQILRIRHNDVTRQRQNGIDSGLLRNGQNYITERWNNSIFNRNNTRSTNLVRLLYDQESHLLGQHSRRRTANEINHEVLYQQHLQQQQQHGAQSGRFALNRGTYFKSPFRFLGKIIPACFLRSASRYSDWPTSQSIRGLDPISEIERESCETSGHAYRELLNNLRNSESRAYSSLTLPDSDSLNHLCGQASTETMDIELTDDSSTTDDRANFYLGIHSHTDELITHF